LGWEKRRFNRVPVSLTAQLCPVDIELNPLAYQLTIEAKVVDLSPTGMFAMTKLCYRTGTRFRATIKLDDETIQFFVIVRHAVQKDVGGSFGWGHGTQTIGATQDTVLKMVRYLETVVRQQTGLESTKRAILLPPAA